MNLALLQIIPHFTETQRLDLPGLMMGLRTFTGIVYKPDDPGYVWFMIWLVVTGTMEFDDFPFSWEWNNHPNWRTPSFFRGVGIPPTSDIWTWPIQLRVFKTWNPRKKRPGIQGSVLIGYQEHNKFLYQWIGLRENLQESPIFTVMGKSMVSCKFSLKPIQSL